MADTNKASTSRPAKRAATAASRRAAAAQPAAARVRRSIPRQAKTPTEKPAGPCVNIAVWTNKGGVGKSSITLELAHSLVRAGKRVAIMDFDSQGTMSQILYDQKSEDPDAQDVLAHEIRDFQYNSFITAKVRQQLNIPKTGHTALNDEQLDPLRPTHVDYDLRAVILRTNDPGGAAGGAGEQANGNVIYRPLRDPYTDEKVGDERIPHTLGDKMIGSMINDLAIRTGKDDPYAAYPKRWTEMEPAEWQGLPVNAVRMYDDIPESVDYEGGELVIYPGASHSTDQLLTKCNQLDRCCGPPLPDTGAQVNVQIYTEQKKRTIGRLCHFFQELARQNKFDFILFDLDPSTNALNKWLIAYIADMLLSPAQAGISSMFAMNNQLLTHLPAWRLEVEALGVPTRFSEDPTQQGERTRVGALPRILPVIVTDFDVEAPRPPAAALPLGRRRMVPAHANLVASMRLVFTNSWVPAAGGQPALELDPVKAAKAVLLQAVYLPTSDGEMVVPLWPRMQALGQAHEMGRALSALDKRSYERFFGHSGRGMDWHLVQEEVKLVNERFASYVAMLQAYADLMTQGHPIGQLFREQP